MYYTVNDRTGMIIDSGAECPDPQVAANRFGCPVYIIEGEHSGLSAEPETCRRHDCDSIVYGAGLCNLHFNV